MVTFSADRPRDGVILVARIALVLVYVVFGWSKLGNYAGTVGYMTHVGAPMPAVAALVAIVAEAFIALAVGLGIWTRPLALVLALYTLGTGLIGHRFWTMEGPDRFANAINFYKNISIIGGFLLLYVTGPGKYSLDALLGARTASRERPI